MKAGVLFGASSIVIMAITGWILSLVFQKPGDERAILTSAIIAFVVQVIAFAIIKLSAEKNVIAGWGLGALLRFIVFAVYALVIVKAFALPSGTAMISMAAFFFLSTLIEPLLLKS